MFFLKKLITSLIIPPGVFVILLLLIAFLVRRTSRKVYVLSLFGAVILYLLSVGPVKDLLLLPLEREYDRPSRLDADAIVVLGGGVYGSGTLTGASVKRLMGGYILHRRTGLPLILSGGAPTGGKREAYYMKKLLVNIGADPEKIYTDQESRDTYENALYVRKICKDLGCRRVLLVTSAFHMGRSVMVFRKVGLEVIPYPVDYRYGGIYNIYSLLPGPGTLDNSSLAIREYIGRVYYSLLMLFR